MYRIDTGRRENMAKNGIYGIYDEASEGFVQFLPANNDAVAKMTLEKMYKDRRLNIPLIFDYPNNYKAYKIAIFDDNTGLFENTPQHIFLLDFGSIVTDSQ